VVALLFVMLLVGMLISALVFGWLLTDFSQLRLIKVVQGAAVLTMALNIIALWKQEQRSPSSKAATEARPKFRQAWAQLAADRGAIRLLVAVALGTAGFTMQDVLLEPFGGQVLGLSVAATTVLTALLAAGTLAAFALAARLLAQGMDPHRLASYGVLVGIFAFSIVTIVAASHSVAAFRAGVVMIGFGAGLFGVGTLTATMSLAGKMGSGLALGAWGAVQATAAGVAVASGGALRDLVSGLAAEGVLGPALTGSGAGYGFVYQFEVFLLFVTLVAIGPLARHAGSGQEVTGSGFGLAEFPG
jgi:BCD family chlorophyll transporter-like MFS transporter